MYKMSMSLNDAYDFVRRKKANISPNFNFMGQLLDFERQLNPPSPQRCTCHLQQQQQPDGVDGGVVKATEMVIPFTRLSIEEKDDEDDPTGCDSGLPSSASSTSSSPAPKSFSAKRLRTLVCRCQASLSQCHFTTPTTL